MDLGEIPSTRLGSMSHEKRGRGSFNECSTHRNLRRASSYNMVIVISIFHRARGNGSIPCKKGARCFEDIMEAEEMKDDMECSTWR